MLVTTLTRLTMETSVDNRWSKLPIHPVVGELYSFTFRQEEYNTRSRSYTTAAECSVTVTDDIFSHLHRIRGRPDEEPIGIERAVKDAQLVLQVGVVAVPFAIVKLDGFSSRLNAPQEIQPL